MSESALYHVKKKESVSPVLFKNLGFKKKISTFFRLSQHKECAMHRVLSKCQFKLAGKPGKKKAKAVVDIFGVGN